MSENVLVEIVRACVRKQAELNKEILALKGRIATLEEKLDRS